MTESQIRFLYKTRAVLYGSNISKGVKQILLGVLHQFQFFARVVFTTYIIRSLFVQYFISSCHCPSLCCLSSKPLLFIERHVHRTYI